MRIAKKALFTLFILAFGMTGTLLAAAPEDSFRQSFPDIPLEGLQKTDIPGIYEIIAGGRVAYYVPAQEYLIIGEIVTKEKKNLTQARNTELQVKKFKDLPLEKAVKIGNGPRTIIEITDPDCPFCRKASEYFATRNDVTRYVYLYPLPSHTQAEAKIKYILGAKDKAKAYEEAMTGKLDDMKFKPSDDAAADELVTAHKEISERIGIQGLGTPMFLIGDQFVRGANFPQIEKILGARK